MVSPMKEFYIVAFLLPNVFAQLGAGSQPSVIFPHRLHRFTEGLNYYRSLSVMPNEGILFVGAQNFVYQLNIDDISDRGHKYLASPKLKPTNTDHCGDDLSCQNNIRWVLRLGKMVLACGTNGKENSIIYNFTNDIRKIEGVNNDRVVGALCSSNIDHSSDSLLVNDSIFSATESFKLARSWLDPRGKVIKVLRSYSRADDTLIMDGTNYVRMLELPDSILCFMQEDAHEVTEFTLRYPRVARVCKDDEGGTVELRSKFLTLQKARLVCTIPGRDGLEPLPLTHLEYVRRDGDTIYGLFSSLTHSAISAICSFDLRTINQKFDTSPLVDAAGKGGATYAPGTDRPGTCGRPSRKVDEAYASENVLLAESIMPQTKEPLFVSEPGQRFVNFVLKNSGDSLLVVLLISETGGAVRVSIDQSRPVGILQRFHPFGIATKIQQMVMSNDQIYISSDKEIRQFGFVQCELYEHCNTCSRDPACGWSPTLRRCVPHSSAELLISQIRGSASDALQACQRHCQSANVVRHELALYGDSVFLDCASFCLVDETSWKLANGPILFDQKQYIKAGHGLVVMNISAFHEVEFECKHENVVLKRHRVHVKACPNNEHECTWKTEFRDWCSRFANYRTQYNHWQCNKRECELGNTCSGQSSNCPLS